MLRLKELAGSQGRDRQQILAARIAELETERRRIDEELADLRRRLASAPTTE